MAPIPHPVRLADVAVRAGVSVITASRALRTPGKVAPETRARIEEAVRALGYVPNLVAGALASARTRTIAVLVPTIASSVFAATVNGLTDALEAEGYAILLAQSGYDPTREQRALAALLGRRPEGVITIGSPMTAAARAMLESAAQSGAAVVETWELPARPVGAAVGFHNASAGRAVAARFAAQGRKKWAFIGGPDARAAARWRGFAAGARQAGIDPPARIQLAAPAAMEDATVAWIGAAGPNGLARADAIFAANDVHAVGLLTALRAHGRKVPDDVAVIGLGDLPVAQHTVPALTTVRIDGAEIGRRAAALIAGQAYGGSASEGGMQSRIDVGFELLVRQSG